MSATMPHTDTTSLSKEGEHRQKASNAYVAKAYDS
jgi:hypothetical protein